jgi:hypothetical protein
MITEICIKDTNIRFVFENSYHGRYLQWWIFLSLIHNETTNDPLRNTLKGIKFYKLDSSLHTYRINIYKWLISFVISLTDKIKRSTVSINLGNSTQIHKRFNFMEAAVYLFISTWRGTLFSLAKPVWFCYTLSSWALFTRVRIHKDTEDCPNDTISMRR